MLMNRLPTKKAQNKVTGTSFIYPRARSRTEMPQNQIQQGGILGGYIQVTTKQPRMFCIVHGAPMASFLSFLSPFFPRLRHRHGVEPPSVQLLFFSQASLFLSVSRSSSPPHRREGRPETQRHGKRRRREGHAWWRVERGREWLVLLFRACG
ncbi:hypothetical protein HDV63DRAFT_22923 [Trichoderma sp. SZMC 28014]